jgi:hypothetical protein
MTRPLVKLHGIGGREIERDPAGRGGRSNNLCPLRPEGAIRKRARTTRWANRRLHLMMQKQLAMRAYLPPRTPRYFGSAQFCWRVGMRGHLIDYGLSLK